MIASSLSTSGVTNCEVVAACPFEVSGTGALTGIQMAYETASGQKLDETKTKLANEEMVVTGNLADQVGKNEATTVVNQSKMDVIQNNVQNADEIQNIVINVAEQNNVSVSQEEIDKIVSLLEKIAEQGYNYDDVKETLEQVNENTTGQASSGDDTLDGENKDDTVEVDGDSDDITNSVDDSVLGDDVIQSSTEDPTLEIETDNSSDSSDGNGTGIPDATDDGTYSESDSDESASDESSSSDESGSSDETASDENASEGTDQEENSSDEAGIPEATEDGTYSEDGSDESASDEAASTETDSTEPDTSVLSEEAKNNYDKLALFVKGEYEGDADSLLAATESTEEVATVTLDEQTGKNLAATVEKDYYDILNNGTDSYEADGTETYQSTELNMMDRKLKKLFGIGAAEDGTDENADVTDETKALLADVTEEDKQTLYKDTMKFLAGLYGENTDSAADESTAE